MTFFGRLWRVEGCTILAVLVVALVLWLFEIAMAWRSGVQSPARFTWGVVFYALILGGAPAVLFGAPLYALMNRLNKASWWVAAIIGAVPGIAVAVIGGSRFLPMYFLICGIAVAIITHVAASAWINGDAAP